MCVDDRLQIGQRGIALESGEQAAVVLGQRSRPSGYAPPASPRPCGRGRNRGRDSTSEVAPGCSVRRSPRRPTPGAGSRPAASRPGRASRWRTAGAGLPHRHNAAERLPPRSGSARRRTPGSRRRPRAAQPRDVHLAWCTPRDHHRWHAGGGIEAAQATRPVRLRQPAARGRTGRHASGWVSAPAHAAPLPASARPSLGPCRRARVANAAFNGSNALLSLKVRTLKTRYGVSSRSVSNATNAASRSRLKPDQPGGRARAICRHEVGPRA